MLKKIFSFFDIDYGISVQNYIISRNPQNTADIERLQREFERFCCRPAYF